jgi:hypothetical protein
MEPDWHNVLVETIYDHLSIRRKARWTSQYQQIVSAKALSEWRLDEVWNRLAHRMLADEKEGILAPAKGREREAITRVADLYQRLVDGHVLTVEEWKAAADSAFGYACNVKATKLGSGYWKVIFWLALTLGTLGFAIANCSQFVKPVALLGFCAAWWAYKKVMATAKGVDKLADIPIQASKRRAFAAWQAAKWLAESPDTKGILEFELRDGSEDYTAQEEWMAKTLTMMVDAAAATSAAFSLEAGLKLPDSDESARDKQDYWNWLSEALLQILRESSAANIPRRVAHI